MSEQRVAGRELDAEIAERVMGNRVVRGEGVDPKEFYGEWPSGFYADPRRYSVEIKYAWRVVENMANRGWKVDVQNRFPPTWACHVNFSAPNYARVFETANSAPLAICNAALRALDADKPTGDSPDARPVPHEETLNSAASVERSQ